MGLSPVKIYEDGLGAPGPIVGGYFKRMSTIDKTRIVNFLKDLDGPSNRRFFRSFRSADGIRKRYNELVRLE